MCACCEETRTEHVHTIVKAIFFDSFVSTSMCAALVNLSFPFFAAHKAARTICVVGVQNVIADSADGS
jgi:hypothetical protein